MHLFSKSSLGLLAVGIIACSTLLISPAQARARADPDDDEEEDWGGWLNSEESGEDDSPQSGRAVAAEGPSADHSHHNHPPPVLQAAAPPLGSPGVQSSWDPAKQGSGLQSGNYAAHNESCSPTGKTCPRENNLECSTNDGTGRCRCISSYVYVRQTETCWLIPKSDQDVCAHDIQCHAGSWGSMSRCDKHSGRCQCYDFLTGGKREMKLVDGVCYIQKTRGDLCTTHEECDKTIRGGAYCKPGDHQSGSGQNYNGSCQCRDITHMWWGAFKACLQLSTKLNSDCVVSEQCNQGSLGKYSKCGENGKCECWTWNNGTETVYYDKLSKCFERREYNSTCKEADECRASLGPDVECGPIGETPEGQEVVNVCHCPSGKVCRSSAFSTMIGAASYTKSLVVAAAVLGMSLL